MLITNEKKLKDFYAEHRVWQGVPGIAMTRKGRTFVSFYSGEIKETLGNYAILIMSDDGKSFTEPIAVAKKDGAFRCYDPVVWLDPLERLWFIWSVMPGEEVMAAICENPDADTLVWSKEFYIGRGIMMNKPTVLSTGEWLFPIAIWKREIFPEYRECGLRDDDVEGSYVYRTTDNGKSFTRLGHADIQNRYCDEHTVLECDDGSLRMFVRRNDGIGESYSYDGGLTWSEGIKSDIEGPSARFHIERLKSGNVLLVNHYKFTGRNNLTAMLSTDGGKTFPYTLLLDERHPVSYPDAVEGEDGLIHVVYDYDRGCNRKSLEEAYAAKREILLAAFTEEDIIRGKITSAGGYTKRVISKLTALATGDPDPFISLDD